jgi:hypothetical protein
VTATAEAVLNVARGELGYQEGRNNDTKYGEWFGMNHQPYCDMFVSWCAAKAGASDIIARTAYVPGRLAKARADGATSKAPRVGDLACFDFGRDGTPDHIGFVERVLPDGRIQTIEANTSPPTGYGSQSDGGGVYRRNRSQSLVLAYIHPAYAHPTTIRPAPLHRGVRPLVVDGHWGPLTTQHLQLLLRITPVDGVMGRRTVRAWQRWLKRPATGLVSIADIKAMQHLLAVPADGAVGPVTSRALQMYLNRAL